MNVFDFGVSLEKAYKDSKGKLHVVGIASDTEQDLDKERMSDEAISLMVSQARMGIPLLGSHRDAFGFGISRDAEVKKENGKILYVVDFELDDKYPQSADLFDSVLNGTCDKQLSIGGNVIDGGVSFEMKEGKRNRVINKIKLDHIAVTRKGRAANPRTGFVSAIIKSLDEKDAPVEKEKEVMEGIEKAVVTFKSYPVVEETGWDGAKEENTLLGDPADWTRFKNGHAYVNLEFPGHETENPPQVKAAYKLPHHVMRDGEMKTHFPGTVFAMAATLGARGGVALPREEKEGVYNHLAGHYKDAGKEAPEFRLVGPFGKGTEKEESVWTYGEFKEFHTKQGINIDWLTPNLWSQSITGVSMSDIVKEVKKEEVVLEVKPEVKPEEKQENRDEIIGKSIIGRIGEAIMGIFSTPSKEVKLSKEVISFVDTVKAIKGSIEKSEYTEKWCQALDGMMSLMQIFLDAYESGKNGTPVGSVATEDYPVMLEREILHIVTPTANLELSKEDISALRVSVMELGNLSKECGKRKKKMEKEEVVVEEKVAPVVVPESEKEKPVVTEKENAPVEVVKEVKEAVVSEVKPEVTPVVAPVVEKDKKEEKKQEIVLTKEMVDTMFAEKMEKSFANVEKTIVDVLTTKLTEVEARLRAVEKVGGVSQSISGQEQLNKSLEGGKKKNGLWGGMFSPVLKETGRYGKSK